MEVDLDPDRIGKVAKEMAAVVRAHLAAGPESPFTVLEILNAAAWVVATIVKANNGAIDAEAFFLGALEDEKPRPDRSRLPDRRQRSSQPSRSTIP